MDVNGGGAIFRESPGETDRDLAAAAVEALREELAAFPKPGLVSPVDSGAHDDMDFTLMARSADSLRKPFARLAAAGRAGRGFEDSLMPVGIDAERRMLLATDGVNTHRGAIFSMGLLVAALAAADGEAPGPPTAADVRAALLHNWGAALQRHAQRGAMATSHGSAVRRSTGRDGAREEAASGFPSLFDLALPAYRQAAAAGLDGNACAVQTLFVLMAAVDDTTVLHRGGLDGGAFVRRSAVDFLAAGGCRRDGWRDEALALHRAFVARRLSAGGCADLLACTILLARRCAG